MSTLNRVYLMGHVTRDPELRHTASGMAVSDLGIAVNDKYRNKQGELVDRACFADAVVWGRQAETCCEYLKKGAPVLVEGRLQLDQWQTDAGEKRSRLRVCADRVQFLNRRNAESTELASGGGVSEATEAATSEAEIEMPF